MQPASTPTAALAGAACSLRRWPPRLARRSALRRGRAAGAAERRSSSRSTRCAPTTSAATATHGASTPTLDGLAARGVRFATAMAHAPLTAPSHASILTGRTPLGHGFRNNGGFVLPAEVRTRGRGLPGRPATGPAAFVSGFPLDRRFGFDRGFEIYDDHLPARQATRGAPPTSSAPRTHDRRRAAAGSAATRQTRGRRGSSGSTTTTRTRPTSRPPIRGRRGSSPYDGEIAFVDAQLGAPAAARSRRAGAGADARPRHRRPRREPGRARRGHARHLPLRRDAAGAAGSWRARASPPGVVAPTRRPRHRRAADAARLRRPPAARRCDGRSLRPAADGRALDDAPAYAESLHSQLELGWAPLHAWRTATLQAHRGAARRSSTTSRRTPARRTTARPRTRRAWRAMRRGAPAGDGDRPRRSPTQGHRRRDAPSGSRPSATSGGGGGRARPRRPAAIRRTASAS